MTYHKITSHKISIILINMTIFHREKQNLLCLSINKWISIRWSWMWLELTLISSSLKWQEAHAAETVSSLPTICPLTVSLSLGPSRFRSSLWSANQKNTNSTQHTSYLCIRFWSTERNLCWGALIESTKKQLSDTWPSSPWRWSGAKT